jgi:putative DNA primase/helicase
LKHTGILKNLTGGDAVPAEFKWKHPFHFVNFAKLIFSANDIPQTPDESDAFFARLIIINFPNQYLGNKADPYLIDKITTEEELSGLLSIILRRLPRVLAGGIYVPNGTIEENYTKYIQSSNPIRAFVETMIDKDTDIAMNSNELKVVVYEGYQRFCNDRKLGIEGSQTFNRKLKKDYGLTDDQFRVQGKKEWFWTSIKLKEYVKVDEDQETF